MKRPLEGKTILVTGGSRGIGKACVEQLAEQGAAVILQFLQSEAPARELASTLTVQGSSVKIHRADLASAAEVANLFAFVREGGGRLDALVNNAGILRPNLLHLASEKELSEMVALNVTGAFLCMQKAARIMMRQGTGTIVNVSSIMGRDGAAGHAAYAATKGAVIAMTTSAAKELGPLGITVNAVAPGIIETDMLRHLDDKTLKRIVERIPLGRLGSPAEVASVVAFLCSDGARYISGQVIGIDGCYTS